MYEIALKKPASLYPEYPRKSGNKEVTHYCPGCGHGIIHKYIAEALDELQLAERTVVVSPVGCSVFAYYYFHTGNVQSAHGRAPAVATGIKRANPESIVISYQGDGDLAAIGTAEVIQAANRGEQISVFFVNNAIYGMTGGQMAPTTLVGQKTATCPRGRDPHNEGYPMHMAEIISQLTAPVFVERVSLHNAGARMKARKAIKKALDIQNQKKGFTFVEILAPCPTNWKIPTADGMKWIEEHMLPIFPLANFRDQSSEAEPYSMRKPAPADGDLLSVLNIPAEDEQPPQAVPVPDRFRNPRIKVAGFGGQGVILMGIGLAQIGMKQGYNASWLPSYGPEMRGGTAHCHINISETPIGSPMISTPNICVAFNRPSMEKFVDEVAPGGILIGNSSMIENGPSRTDIEYVACPVTQIALDLGNVKFANMVMLGAILGATDILPLETAFKALPLFIYAKKFIPDNIKAIQAGYDYIKQNARK